MTQLLHKDLTGRIIGTYYTVFNKLSQSYPEFIYERAMTLSLERQGIRCSRQDEPEIWYKERLVGLQRLDIFVADEVVVELKVADQLAQVHLAQLLSYLKAVSKEVGLLFRFGGPEPDFARRVLTAQTEAEALASDLSFQVDRGDLLHPELTHEILGGVLEVFKSLGPGFIHRIYANACYHELNLRGLEIMPHREFRVFLDDAELGSIKLGHLQVDNRALVFPVAVSDLKSIRIENLKAWMRYLGVPIGILANFHATRLEPIVLRD
jgi:GxxExxY protein